ncbi:MAG: helix-turn-helix transcriptional regulator [Clostridiales bacterium]|nr:helix-turn-helix transcriptional regulator [Clostridiales bacterium]
MRFNNLKEYNPHGTKACPIQCYKLRDNYADVNHHWHNETEIIFVEHGDVLITTETNKKVFSSGEFCFINSGELHSIQSFKLKESAHSAVVFNFSMLSFDSNDIVQETLINPILNGSLHLPFYVPFKNELKDIWTKILYLTTEKPFGWLLEVKIMLYKVILILYRENLLEETGGHSPTGYINDIGIQKAVYYMQDNYNERIYLDEIAKTAGMNSQHFCRSFKKKTGKTPMEFLNIYRIEQACVYLCESELTVSEIALQCGFISLSFFTKQFSRYKGCTPGKYRKERRNPHFYFKNPSDS